MQNRKEGFNAAKTQAEGEPRTGICCLSAGEGDSFTETVTGNEQGRPSGFIGTGPGKERFDRGIPRRKRTRDLNMVYNSVNIHSCGFEITRL